MGSVPTFFALLIIIVAVELYERRSVRRRSRL